MGWVDFGHLHEKNNNFLTFVGIKIYIHKSAPPGPRPTSLYQQQYYHF